MYPMKLAPAYKDYLWGGHELERLFGKAGDGDCTAEAGNSAVIRMEKVRSEMEHLRGKHWKKYWISFQNMFPTNFNQKINFRF